MFWVLQSQILYLQIAYILYACRGAAWIGSKTAPKKREWVVENLLWMGEMKQDREGYLMKIMSYLVKQDNISDILMKFFHFELACV
jgi:hypothetical protein